MMRAIAIASLLGSALAGCSAATTEDGDSPPVLEITSPARGTTVSGSQVTVTGTVQDNQPGVRVTINGTGVTPAANGAFTATVPVGSGIELLETHAIDSSGNDVRDVRAVLAGALAPSDGTTASPIGARIGPAAFTKIGALIATTLEGLDLTAATAPMNPIYNNTGCLGAVLNITSADVGNVELGLVPGATGLATSVALDNVVVRMHAKYKVACIGGSTTITVITTRARINGAIGVTTAGGALVTSLPSATVALDGFNLDIGGIPGALESLVRGEARKAAEKALTDVIKTRVPTMANAALAGVLAQSYTAAVLGQSASVMVTPKQVAMSADGLFVAVDTKLAVSGGEGGMYVSSATPLSASMIAGPGLGVAIADDTVNQLFSGLWAAGAMEQTVNVADVGVVAALLDDDAHSLSIELMLPPTVTGATGALELEIGDLMVSVRDQSGAEIQKLALSISTELSASPTQEGKITLAVGTPTIKAQVLAQTEVVDRPLTGEQVEGIVSGVWGVVGGLADEALANLPMPSVAGVTFGAPSVVGADGYVIADLPLE